MRSLWRAVQVAIDQVLVKATLRDLLQNEEEMNSWVRQIPGAMQADWGRLVPGSSGVLP